MQFNKIFLSISLSLFLVNPVFAESTENNVKVQTNEIQTLCKHTAMHYATSIENVTYVKKLLDRKEFSLYEKNYQCQTPVHIAAELGNVVILNLFYKYLGGFDVLNGKNETPLMTAIKNNQHQAILYMISKDSNLEHVNDNGLSVNDYFYKYGDYLTQKIIKNQENKKTLENLEQNFKNKDKEYNALLLLIKEKEVRIETLIKENGDSSLVVDLRSEISLLKEKIKLLEDMLKAQEIELAELRNLREIYEANLHDNVKNSPAKKKEELDTHIPEDEYLELLNKFKSSNEGDVNNIADELKLMELLSQPRYKIKKKD